jgi:cytochrome c oxidase cbb3-type subunit 3
MLYRRILEILLMTAVCVASGTLECSHPQLSETQTHGKELYGRMCAVCHGRGRRGLLGRSGSGSRPAPTFWRRFRTFTSETPSRLGRPGTTMSAWSTTHSGPLSKGDIDAVISLPTQLGAKAAQGARRAALSGGREPGNGDLRCAVQQMPRSARNRRPEYPYREPPAFGRRDQRVLCGKPFAEGRQRNPHAEPSSRRSARRGHRRRHRARSKLAKCQCVGCCSWLPLRFATPRCRLARYRSIPVGPRPVGLATPFPSHHVGGDRQRAARSTRLASRLLDARAPSDYIGSHIAGAVSVPFYEPEPYFDQLPRDTWLVCYCACPHAESSTLAQKLVAHGFTKVTVLDEGLGYWSSKNYGIHNGTEP